MTKNKQSHLIANIKMLNVGFINKYNANQGFSTFCGSGPLLRVPYSQRHPCCSTSYANKIYHNKHFKDIKFQITDQFYIYSCDGWLCNSKTNLGIYGLVLDKANLIWSSTFLRFCVCVFDMCKSWKAALAEVQYVVASGGNIRKASSDTCG